MKKAKDRCQRGMVRIDSKERELPQMMTARAISSSKLIPSESFALTTAKRIAPYRSKKKTSLISFVTSGSLESSESFTPGVS